MRQAQARALAGWLGSSPPARLSRTAPGQPGPTATPEEAASVKSPLWHIPHRSSSDLMGGTHCHFHRPEEAPDAQPQLPDIQAWHSAVWPEGLPKTQTSNHGTCNTQRALLNLWVISLLNNEKENNESAGLPCFLDPQPPTQGLRGLTSQMCNLIAGWLAVRG